MSPNLALTLGFQVAAALLAGHLGARIAAWREYSKSALYMAIAMTASGLWAALGALESIVPGFAAKVVLANLQYIPNASIPALWFLFARSFAREQSDRDEGRAPFAVWIIPAAACVLAWLDPWLGLLRRGLRLDESGGPAYLDFDPGPLSLLLSLSSYALIAAGMARILRAVRLDRSHGGPSSVIIVSGCILPLGANIAYASGTFPSLRIDPTPLSLAATGLLLVLYLSRFRSLALRSEARATAVEALRDPLLVLDARGRLAYFNSAARETFALARTALGKPIRDLGAPLDALEGLAPNVETELRLHAGGVPSLSSRRFEARSGSVLRRGREIGRVVTLFDITRRAEATESMMLHQARLEEGIAERTRELEKTAARLSSELEQRIRAERQLARDALQDPLTGLANRSLLLNRVEQAIARARRDDSARFGIIYVDFDGFKAINDGHGHGAGDVFLLETAARLRRCLREADTIARLAGDEFVILLEGSSDRETIRDIVDRLADELVAPIGLGGATVVPSASIGIVHGGPGYGSASDAIGDADIAMRLAKSRGRNTRVFFEDSMRLEAAERNHMEDELRAAIAAGGIGLAFQPIVTMDGAIAGWEVLARWRSSAGLVEPNRFIHMAEESGLIIPLGTFVLIEALRTASALRDAGLIAETDGRWPFFAVNVSAIQLLQPDFPELVLSAVERSGLPCSFLHLEITESAIMENREAAIAALRELSAAGISFKLDDFGTGYSSLGYLHHLPIDSVKIDRSFIDRIDEAGDSNSASLVRGIVSLGQALGKTIVAEGIETEAQAVSLRECGCDFGQGWLFGKPMDRKALEDSLRIRTSLS